MKLSNCTKRRLVSASSDSSHSDVGKDFGSVRQSGPRAPVNGESEYTFPALRTKPLSNEPLSPIAAHASLRSDTVASAQWIIGANRSIFRRLVVRVSEDRTRGSGSSIGVAAAAT